jgi:hypothetical protein
MYIEEEQTTTWSKEQVQKDKQRSTKHKHIKNMHSKKRKEKNTDRQANHNLLIWYL